MGFEDNDLNNLKATELRLGLPGTEQSEQESSSSSSSLSSSCVKNVNNKRSCEQMDGIATAPKAQVIGWPPVRSYRKNIIHKNSAESESSGTLVKVSMDGAPYLRKIDLCGYTNYSDLLQALENMFKCSIGEYSQRSGYNGSEYFALTYEDKDGDWMLAGDVPWDMFAASCKRLRIMKGSEAKGLGCL